MLKHLLELRPYAFHTCGVLNFASIQRSRTLRSAVDLLRGTKYEHLLRMRRKASEHANLASGPVEVRDNLPLRPGSVVLESNQTLEDFLYELNSRVFFWPGTERGPIPNGSAHFEHYFATGEVRVIRVSLDRLLAVNIDKELQVTYCNSGSARHQQGHPVVRGPSTFQSIHTTEGRAAHVKELTFLGFACLPLDTVWSQSLSGPWQPI